MIVRVEVHEGGACEDRPYRPGVAHVYVNGRLIVKLRTCESAEVETNESVTTRVNRPLGLSA